MKISKIIYGFLFITFVSLVIASCKDDDELYPQLGEDPKNIAEIAAETPELASFSSALFAAGLDSIMRSTTTYTVLAPNNGAFGVSTLPIGDELENELLNHILVTTTPDFISTMSTGYLTTMATGPDDLNLSIFINASAGDSSFNGVASLVDGLYDLGATNGIIHTIDALLLPPTITDHAKANPNYSSFVEAMELADFTEDIEGEDLFTVFAPSNAAFEDFLMIVNGAFGWATLNDIPVDILNEILSYHTVASVNLIAGALDGSEPTTVQGEMLIITGLVIDDATYIDANIVVEDIQAINGIIQGIDKVLIPEDIFQNILSGTLNLAGRCEDKGYNVFIEAIEKVGLTSSLENDELTVFAPSDGAFESFFTAIDNYDSLDDFDTPEGLVTLKSLMEYHLYAGALQMSDLADQMEVTTVNEDFFTVGLSGADVNLTPTYQYAAAGKIDNGNIGATNGILQGINRVLVPDALGVILGYPIPLDPPPVFGYDVYTEGPQKAGWTVGGWGAIVDNSLYDFSSTDQRVTGLTSLKMDFGGSAWTALNYQSDVTVDITTFTTFKVSIYAEESGQQARITLNGNFNDTDPYQMFKQLEGGQWNHFEIPLSDIGDPSEFTSFGIQYSSGGVIYVDDVGFDGATAPRYGIYSDGPQNPDWTIGGWGSIVDNSLYDFSNLDQVSTGSASLKLDFDGSAWTGWNYQTDAPVDMSPYTMLKISIYAVEGGQQARIALNGNFNDTDPYQLFKQLEGGQWNHFEIPLSDIGSPAEFTAIGIQYSSGTVLYLDDIELVGDVPTPDPLYEVYTNGPQNPDWTIGGWGSIVDNSLYDFSSLDQVSTGSASLKLDYDGSAWTGWNYQTDVPVDMSPYTMLKISIYAVESGQQARIALNGNFNDTDPYQLFKQLEGGQWNHFEIPLSDIGSPTEFTAIGIQYSSGTVLYLDDIVFN